MTLQLILEKHLGLDKPDLIQAILAELKGAELVCPKCSSHKCVKAGFQIFAGGKKQMCSCNDCGHRGKAEGFVKL